MRKFLLSNVVQVVLVPGHTSKLSGQGIDWLSHVGLFLCKVRGPFS
jgi:hypothetical protein